MAQRWTLIGTPGNDSPLIGGPAIPDDTEVTAIDERDVEPLLDALRWVRDDIGITQDEEIAAWCSSVLSAFETGEKQ